MPTSRVAIDCRLAVGPDCEADPAAISVEHCGSHGCAYDERVASAERGSVDPERSRARRGRAFAPPLPSGWRKPSARCRVEGREHRRFVRRRTGEGDSLAVAGRTALPVEWEDL